MNRMITPVSFSKIPVLEFPELVNTFVSIVDSYGAETMFVAETTAALKERMPQLQFLKVPQGKHAESPAIQALLVKRKDVLIAMAKQSKALLKAGLSSQTDQMLLVAPFVERYWGDIYNFNQITINRRLALMFSEIESTPDLQTAFQLVGLSAYTDELNTLEDDLHTRREVRRKSQSLVSKTNSVDVKSYLGETLTDLVNAIELARKAHTELDYTAMINEINQLFTTYQSEIKSRATRNKTAKSKTDTTPTTTSASESETSVAV